MVAGSDPAVPMFQQAGRPLHRVIGLFCLWLPLLRAASHLIDAGHFAVEEKSADIAELIRGFLDAHAHPESAGVGVGAALPP